MSSSKKKKHSSVIQAKIKLLQGWRDQAGIIMKQITGENQKQEKGIINCE